MNHYKFFKISDFVKHTHRNLLMRAASLLLILCWVLPAQATHIVGGELYYNCLGNNQYEVTLTIYRDCLTGVAEFDDPASIGVFEAETNLLVDTTLIAFDPSINDTLFIDQINPCLEIEGEVCIHRTIYKDTLNLPFRAEGYILAYQRCCRNAAIVNIVEPTETGATYVARVTEEALLECDNSPVFNDWPPIFVCLNRPIDFDHSATDIDGDSLVYRMCTPYSGATKDIPKPQPPNNPPYDNVTYIGDYNEGNMLGNPANPLSIDPATGFLTGIPTVKGQFVVGICVDEYRDGQLISTTRRDFQYIVGECSEITSAIGNPSIQCDDLEVDFINTSFDATEFIWDFGDPNSTTDTSTVMSPSYVYPDTGQYIVTLISNPGDPCGDTLQWELFLRNSTVEPDFNAQILRCEDGLVIVVDNISNDQFNQITDYTWEVDGIELSNLTNPVFEVPNNGQDVTITLFATATDGCTNSITKVIRTGDFPSEIPRDTLYACMGDMIELFPTAVALSTINYDWTPTMNLDNSSIANPTLTAMTTGLYTLTMTTNGSSCSAQFEKYVIVSDVQNVDINAVITNTSDGSTTSVTDTGAITTCEGEFVTLTTTNVNSTIVSYEWTDEFGNIITPNQDGEITAAPDGTLTYTVIITDDQGCTASDQITIDPNFVDIQVDELVNNDGANNGLTDVTGDGILDMCPGDVGNLNVTNLNMGEALLYQWTGDTGLITAGANSANPTITANVESGMFNLTVTATNQAGCSASVDVPIQIHGIPPIDIEVEFTDLTTNTTTNLGTVDELTVCGDEQALLSLTSTTTLGQDVTYTWCNSEGENVGFPGDLLVVTPDGVEVYTVKVTNAAGCTAESSITINGSPIDIIVEETDEDPNNGSGLEDIDGDGTLDLCVGDVGALTVTNLDPSDINTYQWMGDTQILNSATSPNPSLQSDQSGVYTLYLETTNQYGCDQQDTILVEIHDGPEIDIDATLTDSETGTETTISGEDVITSCDDGLIVLTTTGVTSTTDGVTIAWFDEDNNPIGADTSVTVDPDGELTYTVQVTNQYGCVSTSSITIQGSPIDITIEEVATDTDGDGYPDMDVNSDGLLDLCLDEITEFHVTNNDSDQTLTYAWSSDDSSITIFGENSATPAVEPTQPGVYELYLETTNQWGCNQFDTIPIFVLEAIEPIDFTYLQECLGFTINFNTDNPNYEYYTWNFGDANATEITAAQSPSFTYDEAGTYTVTLTPLEGIDCDLDAISMDVVVNTSIVQLDFSYEYSSCSPDEITIQFTDESSSSQGGIKSWNWMFSNGDTSSEQNPSITISEDTDLVVTLTIVNDTDCEGSVTETLDINMPMLIEFPQDTVLCSYDDPIELNPNANPDYTYTWSGGLTGANPAVAPEETTTYSVTVSDNTGAALCAFEQEVTIQVSDEIGLTLDVTGTVSGPFDIDNTSSVNTITTCEEEQIIINTNTLTGEATDYTWTWDPVVAGTTEVVVDLNGSTTYNVTVTDELGCFETASLTVQGGPVDIEIEETTVTTDDGTGIGGIFNSDGTIDLCLGTDFTIQVNNLDPNDTLTYVWTGDPILDPSTTDTGTPDLVPTEAGVYTLYLETTNQFGCVQNDTIPVTVVDPNMLVSFTAVKECDGVTVNFTNNGNPAFDYIWTFGNPGEPGYLVLNSYDATYVYSEVGIFDVMLEVDVNVDCVAPASTQIAIFDPILTAGFDYEYTDCGPEGITILFTDTSVNPENNTSLVEWLINGETYTGSTVEITVTEDTTLEVMQTIYTELDCETSTDLVTLELDVMDETILTPDAIHCQNDPGLELNPTGNPNYTYEWSPSEGLTCSDCPNPIADPDVTTTYTVTVTNNAGALACTIIDAVTLTVPETIILDLAVDMEECTDAADITLTANLDGLSYDWFENDSDTPFAEDVTMVSVEPSGDVTYTVVATDMASQCTESASVTITGTGLNIDVESPAFFCENALGEITVENADPNDELTYQWDGPNILSGDGTATIIIPTDMPFESEYSVTVTNQYECSAVENITAIVLAEPVEPARGQCEGLTITFNLFEDFNTPYYIWDFGDNSPTQTGLGSQVMHTYPDYGTYNVTLTLPNGDLCFDPLVFPVTVNEDVLTAAFAPAYGDDCSDTAIVTLMDGSVSGNQGEIETWIWNLDDYGVFDDQNPTIEVLNSDTITGTLIVGTNIPCYDTIPISQPVIVINDEIDIPDVEACIDTEALLNDPAEDGYTYEWDNDLGTVPSPSVLVNGDATYTVTITNEAQECTSTQTVNVDNYQEMDIYINEPGLSTIQECDDIPVVLTANSESGVTGIDYEWSTGDMGSTITVLTGDGLVETTYIVEATDENGCIEMDSILVSNEQVMVSIEYSGPLYTCAPEDPFQPTIITSAGAEDHELTFVWEGPNIDDPTSASPILTPEDDATYMVTITNNYGCEQIESFDLPVSDVTEIFAEIDAEPDTIFIGNDVDLSVTLGDYEYVWDGNGIDPSDIMDNEVTATPDEVGEVPYNVLVTDQVYEECEVPLSITVTVLSRTCDEPFIFFPNAFTPNGDNENDALMLRYNPTHVTDASWAIYNRWGQKVFETADLNGEWDGTYKGEPVAPDVYGFWLRVQCADGEEFFKQGNVTVLK